MNFKRIMIDKKISYIGTFFDKNIVHFKSIDLTQTDHLTSIYNNNCLFKRNLLSPCIHYIKIILLKINNYKELQQISNFCHKTDNHAMNYNVYYYFE